MLQTKIGVRRIAKNFERELGFKDRKIRTKIRNIHKVGEKYSISISVFGYENKEKFSIYKNHFQLIIPRNNILLYSKFTIKIKIIKCLR